MPYRFRKPIQEIKLFPYPYLLSDTSPSITLLSSLYPEYTPFLETNCLNPALPPLLFGKRGKKSLQMNNYPVQVNLDPIHHWSYVCKSLTR